MVKICSTRFVPNFQTSDDVVREFLDQSKELIIEKPVKLCGKTNGTKVQMRKKRKK